jgi:hypothetical protein
VQLDVYKVSRSKDIQSKNILVTNTLVQAPSQLVQQHPQFKDQAETKGSTNGI